MQNSLPTDHESTATESTDRHYVTVESIPAPAITLGTGAELVERIRNPLRVWTKAQEHLMLVVSIQHNESGEAIRRINDLLEGASLPTTPTTPR